MYGHPRMNRILAAGFGLVLASCTVLLWPGGFGWVRVGAAVALFPVLILAWNRPALRRPFRLALAVWGAAAMSLFVTAVALEVFGQALAAGTASLVAGFFLSYAASRAPEPRRRLPGRETLDLASLVGAAGTGRASRT